MSTYYREIGKCTESDIIIRERENLQSTKIILSEQRYKTIQHKKMKKKIEEKRKGKEKYWKIQKRGKRTEYIPASLTTYKQKIYTYTEEKYRNAYRVRL